jgi:hypothetical protein
VSTIFARPNKNGRIRPILNLKGLNRFVKYNHFKMSSAPRVFTKVMKVIFALFRQRSIRCTTYIDDSLSMNQIYDKSLHDTLFMAYQLERLGFLLNREKSVCIPTTRIVFFGFVLDSITFMVYLTQEKIDKIVALAQKLLSSENITVRFLATFIGVIIQTFVAILPGPLHHRTLERQKLCGLGTNQCFDNVVCLSEQCRQEIQWWLDNVELVNGKLIRQNQISCWLITDASLQGWGAVFEGKTTGGRWTFEEKSSHINYLELMAIFIGLKVFCRDLRNVHIGIQSDNTAAVAYINDMGGMRSKKLDRLAIEIWEWCFERELFLTAQHIPGVSNDADESSRNFTLDKEWKLKTEIFDRICRQLFVPDVDLFASRLSHQLDSYVAWSFDPEAFAIDAFTLEWNGFCPYIFPPFVLLGRILNNIIYDKVEEAIVIVPLWRAQTWFPLLLSVLISVPIRLPMHEDLLILPHSGERHPLGRTMVLTACRVSGNVSRVEDFRERLSRSSKTVGDQGLLDNMSMRGADGSFGVLDGWYISLG